MSIIKKIITLSVLPILLIFSILAFREQIETTIIEYSIQSFCEECFGGKLQAVKKNSQNRVLFFESPEINSDFDLDDGGANLAAEHLQIAYAFDLFQKKIDLTITLLNPKFKIANLEQMSLFSKDESFLKVNKKIIIRNGVIALPGKDVHFNCLAESGEVVSADLVCAFGSPIDASNIMTLNYQEDKFFKLNCKKVDCPHMLELINAVWPPLKEWKVEKGIIDGDIHFSLPLENPSQIVAHGTLSELNLKNTTRNFEAYVQNALFSFKDYQQLVFQNVSFNHVKNNISLFELNNLSGKIDFPEKQLITLLFDGQLSHQEVLSQLQFKGKGNLNSQDIHISLESPSNRRTDVQVQAKKEKDNDLFYKIQFLNANQDDFSFIQTAFSDLCPELLLADIYGGTLDATFIANVNEAGLKDLKLEKFYGQQLQIGLRSFNSFFDLDEVNSQFEIDLMAPDIRHTLNGKLNIKNGNWNFGSPKDEAWLAQNVLTDITILNGKVKESTFKGTLAGLEGEVNCDWFNSLGEVISFDLNGNIQQLAEFLPKHLKKAFTQSLQTDDINFTGKINRHAFGLSIDGQAHVFVDQHNINNSFTFGFDLKHLLELNKFELPPLHIENGWFQGYGLALEKYLSPFLFEENEMHLSGMGDFEGNFNNKFLEVHYNVHDLSLANADFAIEIKNIKDDTGKFAEHYYNFETGLNYGTMPIKNGSFFEKNSGLLFTDIQTSLIFEKNQIHAPEIESFCNGLYLAGTLDVDYSKPETGVFSIILNTHTMNGKFSQVQSLFSHFQNTYFFTKFPLEANVAFRKDGGYFRFDFDPQTYQLTARMQGSITDGQMSSQNFDINLQDLSLDFDYDHGSHQLNFSDIQGTLLVGDPNHVEEYSLVGDHFRFLDYVNSQAEFDIWVGDRQRDIIRVVGKTQLEKNENNDECIAIDVNHDLTHFGDVHPDHFLLTLKDWSEINTFNLELNFKLSTLFRDLQRFSRTGLFFLSRHFLKELNSIKKAEGDLSVKLNYNKNQSLFHYYLTGNDIAIANQKFNHLLLKGKKIDRNWIVDEFLIDDISLSADVRRYDNSWKVNFLGLRLGEALLMGMDGEYVDGASSINTSINLLEIDFKKIGNWTSFQKASTLNPQGLFRGTGNFSLEFNSDSYFGKAEANLIANINNMELQGLPFKDAENVHFHFMSDKGFSIKKLNSGIQLPHQKETLSDLNLTHLYYDINDGSVMLEGLHFSSPVSKLNSLLTALENTFPGFFEGQLTSLIREAKKEGNLEGSLNLELYDPHYALQLTLADGIYYYNNQPHDLKNFIFEFDPCEIKLLTKYRFQQKEFWLEILSKSPTITSGQMTLSDFPSSQTSQKPLTCQWKIDADNTLYINHADGHFCGLDVHLEREENELVGIVKVNIQEAIPLFPPEIAEGIYSWNISKGYTLNGRWSIPTEWKKTTFNGYLEGHEFIFKGYYFDQFSALCHYTPQAIQLRNFQLKDRCGSLVSDHIDLFQNQNAQWQISSPQVMIHHFRPSLLRDEEHANITSTKPFIIRQLEIRDIHSVLGNVNSLVGNGKLFFANPPKKQIANPLFAIPAEILSRIGLDTSVLTPVVGTIHYEIKGGKILLTKFKDIYSEGHVSKFYMPNNNYQSFIDFNGNLHVQVRMKQYNLLFKLAELFTVTIQGTLKKPTYTLQKQKDENVKYDTPIEG